MKPRPAEPAREPQAGGLRPPLLPSMSSAATTMTAAGGAVRIEALHDSYLVRRRRRRRRRPLLLRLPKPLAATAAIENGCCACLVACAFGLTHRSPGCKTVHGGRFEPSPPLLVPGRWRLSGPASSMRCTRCPLWRKRAWWQTPWRVRGGPAVHVSFRAASNCYSRCMSGASADHASCAGAFNASCRTGFLPGG